MVFKIQPWLSFSFFKRMVKQPWLDRLMIFAKKVTAKGFTNWDLHLSDCVFTGIKGGSFFVGAGVKGVKRQLNTNASYKLNSKLERCFMWSQSIGNLPSEIMSSFVVETCIPLSTACSLPICLHMVFAIPFHKLSSYIVFIAFGISGVHYCDPAGPIHRLRRRPRMLKKNAKKSTCDRPVVKLKGFPVDAILSVWCRFLSFFKIKTQPKTISSKKNPHLKKNHHLVVVFQHVKKKQKSGGSIFLFGTCLLHPGGFATWWLPAAEPLGSSWELESVR